MYLPAMRYLVKARVKRGQEKALLRAVADGSLGRGSIAGDEYIYDMEQARLRKDGTEWVEALRHTINALTEEFFDCECRTPLPHENGTEAKGWKNVCKRRENHLLKR